MHERHPNLMWTIAKNATSQTGGKVVLSLIRFGIAILIVRFTGVERFGEYSLVLTVLLVAEWVADFALTDVAVRTACQESGRERSVFRALAIAKIGQVVLSLAFLAVFLAAMGYPAEIVRAGMIGGVGVVFYAGMLVYRAMFKAHMTMERDVAAEIIGVLVSVPVLWIACVRDAPLEVLVATFVLSRVVSFGAAAVMGRKMPPLLTGEPVLGEVVGLIRAAAPLGIAGFLVALYNALDLLMLSKLADVRAVGMFSSAQRFVFPVLIVIDAVGAALFPVLASFWRRRDADFRLVIQRGIDVVLVLAAGAFCLFQNNAAFLLGILGPEPAEAAPVLRLLTLALVVRAATFILAPVLLVTGRQHHALWITAAALVSKAGLLFWLIPAHGVMGVAYAWLVTDLLAGVLPALILTQRIVGFRISLGVVPRIVVATSGCILITTLIGVSESVLGMVVVGVTYPVLILAVRAIQLADLRILARSVGKRFGSGGAAG